MVERDEVADHGRPHPVPAVFYGAPAALEHEQRQQQQHSSSSNSNSTYSTSNGDDASTAEEASRSSRSSRSGSDWVVGLREVVVGHACGRGGGEAALALLAAATELGLALDEASASRCPNLFPLTHFDYPSSATSKAPSASSKASSSSSSYTSTSTTAAAAAAASPSSSSSSSSSSSASSPPVVLRSLPSPTSCLVLQVRSLAAAADTLSAQQRHQRQPSQALPPPLRLLPRRRREEEGASLPRTLLLLVVLVRVSVVAATCSIASDAPRRRAASSPSCSAAPSPTRVLPPLKAAALRVVQLRQLLAGLDVRLCETNPMDGTKWKGHSPVFHEGESVLMEGVIVPTRHDHEAAINNEIASGGVGVGVGGEFRGTMGGAATVGGGLDMVMRMGKGSGGFDTEENGQQEKQQQLNNGQKQQQQQQQHQQEGQGGERRGLAA